MAVFWDFVPAVLRGVQCLFRGDVCRVPAESGGWEVIAEALAKGGGVKLD